jgi:DNA-binding NarL/FixJ family response regulator
VRQGLKALLESEPDVTLVGEASNGLEVLPLVEKFNPDVVIVDVRMPGLNGLDVARQLTQKAPGVKVIVLSMYSDEAYVVQALKNGAMGYVLKESRAADLLQAIREVMAGRRYLSPPLSQKSVDEYLSRADSELDPYETLSPREREVFQLAAEGHSNPDISTRLGISARTVETHRANAMKKLKLKGQTDIVRYAIRKGLVSPGE